MLQQLAYHSSRHAVSSRIFSPRRYQEEAIGHLLENSSAGLFLSPGLGKTAVTLQAIRLLIVGGAIKRALVFAPLRVIYNVWPNEIEKWENFNGLSYSILHGPKRARNLLEDVDIYLANPEGISWLSATNIWNKVDALVVDESSMWRNARTQRYRLIKNKLKDFRRRIILTGSPVPNGLLQLWSQLYLLDLGNRLDPRFTAYRRKYFLPIFRSYGTDWVLREGADSEIHDKISDIVMHRSNDVLDLPPLIENKIHVELPPNAQAMYDALKQDFILALKDKDITAVNSGVLSGKLKQLASGGIYDDHGVGTPIHDAKLKALRELIDEEQGNPLLVFYQYRHELARLREEVFAAPYLGSGVSPKEGREIIRAWNQNELPVLYLHPASAGHGLNLQESLCRAACWFSIPWDLEHYEQATARIWRQGQKHSVVLHHIIARKTIDPVVMRSLSLKRNVQNDLMFQLLQREVTKDG